MRRILIVNADDLGYDSAIDRGIVESSTRGLVRSTTLMVNLPRAAEALALARGAPELAVGLHLNFARGPALGAAPSLVAADGELCEERVASAAASDILAEARAQLERFVQLAQRLPTHLDVHKHLHRHPAVLRAVAQLARERSLPVRAIDPAMRDSLRRCGVAAPDVFFGETGPTAYWTRERLIAVLAGLREGVSELMCHPGYAPVDVHSSYSRQREGELRALTHPAVLAAAQRAGLLLGTFADLQPP